jgi:Holliday junction resolvase-like predicted endonuclease
MSFKINNKIYHSSIYNDNIFIGNYYENIFYNWFNENIINNKIINISKNNRYSHYDFMLKTKKNINLIELKSRLKNITDHQYSIIDCLKIDKLLEIKNEYLKDGKRSLNIIFIFNFVNNNETNNEGSYTTDYYYYVIDEDYLKNNCIIEQRYNKNCYLLPIENIKKLDKDILNIL